MIRLRAFAKVNYGLSVKGVRDDGYHEVATVMQSISLADEVEVEKTDRGFDLIVEPKGTNVGAPEKNTAYRAWLLLCEEVGEKLPARVRLYKKVPSGAGLGGASADAAAVLVGFNEVFELKLPTEKLRELGVRVGADVPFCVSGGTALGEGIGEILTPLHAPPAHALLVAKPESGAETARIYRSYDEEPLQPTSAEPILEALYTGDLSALATALNNDLAYTTKSFVPEVAEYEKKLLKGGALGACMSGTGSAVYGLFAKEEEAQTVAGRFAAPFVGVHGPVTCGVEIVDR